MELPIEKLEKEKQKKEKDNQDRMAMYYYTVFCTSDTGKLILEDILSELFYFADELENDEQVILYNAAKKILKRMQLGDNVNQVMDAMISVSKYRRKE